MPRPWPVLESSLERDYRVFRLRRDRALSPRTGKAHDFYVLETRDWVNVIPLTAANEVVMVRQYRHGVREVTLEIPGGMLDEPGEDPAVAARRELREVLHGSRDKRMKLLANPDFDVYIINHDGLAHHRQ